MGKQTIKVNPVVETTSTGVISSVHFDLTLIVDKENNLVVVDNSQDDCTPFLDCNTLVVKNIKIEIS